jgi:hypothetical protein
LHFYFPAKKKIVQTRQRKTYQNKMLQLILTKGAQADESFDDIADVSMTAADADNTASTGRLSRDYHPDFAELRAAIGLCASITVTPNDGTYPKTITIDFGDACVGLDGKLRSGKIIISLTAPLRQPGSVLTISLENFYINHIHIEGTKTISNLSENGATKFSVEGNRRESYIPEWQRI